MNDILSQALSNGTVVMILFGTALLAFFIAFLSKYDIPQETMQTLAKNSAEDAEAERVKQVTMPASTPLPVPLPSNIGDEERPQQIPYQLGVEAGIKFGFGFAIGVTLFLLMLTFGSFMLFAGFLKIFLSNLTHGF